MPVEEEEADLFMDGEPQENAPVVYEPVPPPAPPLNSPQDVAQLLRLDGDVPLKRFLKTTTAVLPTFKAMPHAFKAAVPPDQVVVSVADDSDDPYL